MMKDPNQNESSAGGFERLTDAELDIMHVLWSSGEPMRVSDIVKKLSAVRSWKTQTAHVLLGRLENKGFLAANKTGYFHTFRPIVAEQDYFNAESEALLHRLNGSVKSMVASLIDANEVSDDEIVELAALLDQKKMEIERQ